MLAIGLPIGEQMLLCLIVITVSTITLPLFFRSGLGEVVSGIFSYLTGFVLVAVMMAGDCIFGLWKEGRSQAQKRVLEGRGPPNEEQEHEPGIEQEEQG